jgi:FixJ family two-component response regulator
MSERDRETIAIIEDDAGLRAALKALLGTADFQARTYDSAEEFLAADAGRPVDCVLADIHLPGMSGVALLQRLAAAGAAVPAVLMTARDDPATLELIRRAGPRPHLLKPFSEDELFAAIRRAIDEPAAPRPA